MERTRAIRAYEQCLCNVTPKLTLKGTSIKQPEEEKRAELQGNARDCIRYAVLNIMKWDPQEAYRAITPEYAKRLRFNEIAKYISFPNGVRKTDYPFMIQFAFPAEIKIDAIDQIIKTYKEILAGREIKFPRYAFEQDDGEDKAAALLFYYINNNIAMENIPHLYEIFADEKKASAHLRTAKLVRVFSLFYDTPLDYFHFSLPPAERDEFEYAYHFWRTLKVPPEILEEEKEKMAPKEKEEEGKNGEEPLEAEGTKEGTAEGAVEDAAEGTGKDDHPERAEERN